MRMLQIDLGGHCEISVVHAALPLKHVKVL